MLDTRKHLVNLIDHHRSSNIMTYYDIIMGYCVILWNIMKYMLKPFVDVCVCCLLSIIPDCSSGSVAGICCNCTRCMMQPWVFRVVPVSQMSRRPGQSAGLSILGFNGLLQCALGLC
jgi:hypothetical protein